MSMNSFWPIVFLGNGGIFKEFFFGGWNESQDKGVKLWIKCRNLIPVIRLSFGNS